MMRHIIRSRIVIKLFPLFGVGGFVGSLKKQ